MTPYFAILGALLLLAVGREFYVFAWLPARAHVAYARGRQAEAKELMRRVAGSWSMLGERARLETRFRLSWMYLADGDAARAADQCRAILTLRLRPHAEANVRRRLADCLEAGGNADEAAEERRRAAALVAGGGADALTSVTRAQMLEQEGKAEEAREAYLQALETIPASLKRQRAEVKVRLALTCFGAGRQEEAVRYAEEALADGPGVLLEMMAHGTAGLGLTAMGRHDEAEAHRLDALNIARKLGSETHAAEYLVQIASSRLARGDLVAAAQGAEQAAGMSHAARRTARLLQSECLRAWGRWDDAREAMLQARDAPGLPVPADERRSLAIVDLGLALVETEAGRPDEALARVTSARQALEGSAKLSLWSDALLARVLAAVGRRDEAAAMVQDVLHRLPAMSEDRSTLLMARGTLQRAAFDLGDHALSRDLAREYLADSPDTVWRPHCLYYLAESELALGDRDAALAALREAAQGIHTHYTERSARRLKEMEG